MWKNNYLAVKILVQWFRKLLSLKVKFFNSDVKLEIKGKNTRIKSAVYHTDKTTCI